MTDEKIYRDDQRKIIIRLVVQGEAPTDTAVPGGGYILRDVYSPYAFEEKIRIFKSGLDDRAVELLKAFTIHANAEKLNGPDSLLFAGMDEEALSFFALAADGNDFLLKTPIGFYEKLRAGMDSPIFDTKGFTTVDSAWILSRVSF
ncbi:CpXC domain-containing protein [Christensenella timonensis]|uniref:CpXC domain-containing protein n=1 Tax=Christensenella timonensis TaxID=1816678 RepID=UPI00082CF0AA|nr:CpXC domain-containing protein [Christensenella timonensis]